MAKKPSKKPSGRGPGPSAPASAGSGTSAMVGAVAGLAVVLAGLGAFIAMSSPPPPPPPPPATERPRPATEVARPRPVATEAPRPKPTEAPKATEPPAAEPEAPQAAPPGHATGWARGQTEKVTVKRTVDGDTVELADGRKVRLVGINTPERDRPLYADARAALKELVEGQEVLLEWDQERVDQFKRSLGYLFKGDLFVNGELVRRGLAYCYTWEPNTAHESELLTFQKDARTARRGLWGLPPPAPESSYVADKRGHRFHRPGCKRADRIAAARRLEFKTRDAALDEGQNPCDECKP